jgi:hypothetical protein
MRSGRIVAGLVGLGVLIVAAGAGLAAGQARGGSALPVPPLADDPEGPLPEVLNQVEPRVYRGGGGRVYRIWVDAWAGQGRHIRFQVSTDGGRSWLPTPRMLDADTPEGGRSTAPAFAVDPTSGALYAAWRLKLRDGSKHVRFATSGDHGASWGPARTLNDGGGAFSAHLAAPGDGHVYAVWYDERRTGQGPVPELRAHRGLAIYFNASADRGRSWLPADVRLSAPGRAAAAPAAPPGPAPARAGGEAAGTALGGEAEDGASGRARRGIVSAQPRVQADASGRVVVVWMDNREGPMELYARASRDHGRSWGPETNVSQGGESAREHQLLTDGAGRFFLVWTDNRDSAPNVFFARSEDGGATWSVPARVSRGPRGLGSAFGPAMALGPEGRVYVAWQDNRHGRQDVYLNVSADGGTSWLDRDMRLDLDAAGTAISRGIQVVTGGPGEVAVVWEDDRTGLEQVLLRLSRDGGRSWSPAEVRVDTTTPTGMRARNPQAVWDHAAGALHLVWERWTGGGRDAERRVEYRRLDLRG